MKSRVEIIDCLGAVSADLTGVSQLVMMLYEEMRVQGVDAERFLVLANAVDHCKARLIGIKKILYSHLDTIE